MEIRRREPGKEEPTQEAALIGSDSALGMAVVTPSDLPSRFLPYPPGASISYRPYNFDELSTFSDSQVNFRERIKFVSRGIICRGMEPEDLTLADWLYLGLLRKISVFQQAKFTVTVPADKALGRRAHSEQIEIASLAVDDIKAPALPAVINLGGRELHFSPLTVGRFDDLLGRLDAEAKAAGDEDSRDPTEAELIAWQCVNAEPDDVLPLVKGAMGAELLGLEKMDEMFAHRVKPIRINWTQKAQGPDEKDMECSETVRVDDPTALVWPFRGDAVAAGGAVRFGLQGNS